MRNRPHIARILSRIYDAFQDSAKTVRNVPWDQVWHSSSELILEDDEGREFIVTVRQAGKSRRK